MSDPCRDAFEEWAKPQGFCMDTFGELYNYTNTESAWQTWQAAWNRQESKAETVHCQWRQWDTGDTWEGPCGMTWWLEEGGPEENEMHYCPKCGKPIAPIPYVDPMEDEDE